ncbi:amino acid adenylation domain-containing protein [Streptomyces anulatus]
MSDGTTADDLRARIAALPPGRRELLEALLRQREDEARAGISRRPDPARPAPPSFGQERMWVLSELGQDAYRYGAAVRLRGTLNPAALRTAVDHLVRRHEVLRTVFDTEGRQVVRPAAPHGLPLVDLTATPGGPPPETLLADALHTTSLRPYDLAVGPLLRPVLFRVAPREHVLLLAAHHVVTDGWSLGVIVEEFATHYRDALAGRPCTLIEPPVQYADYAIWQRRRVTGAERERLLNFWRPRIAEHAVPRLPWDRARPKTPRAGGGSEVWTVTGPRLTALRKTTAAEGATPFMAATAALLTALAHVTGRPDLAVGTLVAGRTRPELARLVGYFANVLPVRLDTGAHPTPRRLLRAVRDETLDVLAHQELPYEVLLEELRRTGDRAAFARPLNVLCVGQQPVGVVDLPGLCAEPIDIPLGGAEFDLTLELRDHGDAWQLALQYDRDLFDHATVSVLGARLLTALDALADAPDEPIAAATRTPRSTGAPEEADPTAVVHRIVERRAAETPDAVAVVDGARHLTYRGLNAAANRLARLLRRQGVGAEDRVALRLERSAESVLAMLAVLKAGAAFVPLDPGFPAQRVAALLHHASPSCLITTEALSAGRRGPRDTLPTVLLDVHHTELRRLRSDDLRLPAHPAQAAYVIHTSGSTGDPKGVVGLHAGLVNRCRWAARAMPYAPDDTCVVRAPLGFVDSVAEVFAPLLNGARLDIAGPDCGGDPTALADHVAGRRATRLLAVPSLLEPLLATVPDPAVRLAPLRLCVTSGEAPGPTLARRFGDAVPGARLFNIYGSAEVAADATAAELDPRTPYAVVPIGTPLDGVRVNVTHAATAHPADDLVPGELLVGGTGLARGYHGQPAATAARFVPDPAGPPGARAFRSGDLARRRHDGTLEHLGRTDDALKIRGMRVEPAAVERVLRTLPGIRDAAVHDVRDTHGALMLAALVITDAPLDRTAVRRALAHRLAAHEIPSRLRAVAALPRTPSGKLDRAALAAEDRRTSRPTPTETPLTPENALPPAIRLVCEVFAALLPDADGLVGPDDDFFELGGHSVLAVRAVHRLRARTGAPIALRDLIEAPTPRTLGARVTAETRRVPSVDPGPVRVSTAPDDRHAPFPLTEVQQAYYIGRSADVELGNVSTYGYVEMETTALDVARFSRALHRVIERHPMLRAVIDEDGTQRVLPEVPAYEVATHDLRELPRAEAERALDTTRAAMSHQVLPADRWPLFDIRASLLPGAVTRLHIGVDSLVCDAHSFGLLLVELADTYRASGPPLPPLGLTFRDCVLARIAERGSAEHRRATAYWRDRLSDLPPGPEIPFARSPENIGRPEFHRRAARLDPERWARLKKRAQRHGLTPSGALLAAFAEIVTLWSRRSHYTLMLTLFDRLVEHPEVDAVVGDFTSLIPLEVDHREPGSFAERARRIQRRLWDDLDHAQVSGVTVMRDWLRARGEEPRAVTPVVFTSNLVASGHRTDRSAPDADSPFGPVVYAVSQTPQVGLDHQVAEVAGALEYSWDVVDALFPSGLLDDAFAAYAAFLDRLAAPGETDWDKVPAPQPPTEQIARRAAVNRTGAPVPDACLHDLVNETARVRPDATAVITGSVRLTYRELVDASLAVARALHHRGVRPGDLVAVAARKGWQQAVAVLGVLQSGAAFMPLDPDQPARRIHRLIESSGVRHILVERAERAAFPGTGLAAPAAVEDCLTTTGSGGVPEEPRTPGDLAYVIHTSGSTGDPKGVVIDHAGAVNTIVAVNRRFSVGPADRVLAVSALHFDLGVYDLFGTWAAGAAVVLPDHSRRTSPTHWAELTRRHGVTIWNSVPALAGLLVEHAEHADGSDGTIPASLRLVLLSGDWIPLDLPGRLRSVAAGCRVIGMGGATEASIWSVWYPVERVDPSWRSVPYGLPMDNQTVHVVDDHGRPRPDWVPGELHIGGRGVALGYWRDPLLTAEKFAELPSGPDAAERRYRTGDIVRFLPQGMLEFLGREDTQVKIAGHRVELGEIETALSQIPGVRAAVVVAPGTADRQRRLVGYYLSEPGAAPDPAQVRERLTEVLPGHAVPPRLISLDRFPLTSNGKVDRGRLRDMPVGPEPGRPRRRAGEWERRIAAIWADVLRLDDIAPDDDFFALGGTSLGAMRLTTRLQAEFGVRLGLLDLYQAPTVAAVAQRLAATADAPPSGASGQAPLAPVLVLHPDPPGRHKPFPLTDVQQAYWLGRLATAELGRVATHTYAELDIEDLEINRLEGAVRRLVARHDSLRTVILSSGRQRVLEHVPDYAVDHLDLRGRSPEDIAGLHARARDELSHRVAPADRWPLFALRTHRLDEQRTRLFISLDLLIADAHSVHVLTAELLTLYREPQRELPPLGVTYRDYVLAVERARTSPQRTRAQEYWRAEVRRLPPAPELPQRVHPRSVEQPRFERLTTSFAPEVWGTLVRRAALAGITPSVVVCTVFCDVLRTFSGREDGFTVNLTTFNRERVHPEIDQVIGDFTTLTLLAVGPARPRFRERAQDLQRRLWERLEHRAVSGVEVLRMLREDPRRRHDSMMPVVFTSMLMPELMTDGEEPVPWRGETVYSVSQTPQVLLDHQISERAGTLTCTWDYVVQVYPDGLVEAVFHAFDERMRRLVTDDDEWGADTDVQHDA